MSEQQVADKFLDGLLAEIASFDGSLFGPVDEVEEGETVVGTATEWQRKLYALTRHINRELKHAKVDHEFDGCDLSTCSHGDLARLAYRKSVLNEILWAAFREEFSIWTSPGVGIRKGWQVVTFQKQKKPQARIKGLIAGIMGIDPENIEETE
jgi:hypothetical protein